MAFWHDRHATAAPSSSSAALHLHLTLPRLLFCLLTVFLRLTSALQYVAGSPCESVCADAGTLNENVVCLDADYQALPPGRAYQKCVACQLNSTAVDTTKNETDVGWGLLAFRYTLAGCMFAWPDAHISISSPCQVSCAALNASIDYHITNDTPTARPGEAFCNVGTFDSTTINRCAFCYSFIPQQLFLANFLQALHISCVQPPIAGKPFFPDAAAIFNETLIAGPAPASNNSGSGSGLHGWKLAVAIALPIVGGILLFGSTCWCCFHFTRKRRQRMAQAGRMSRIHDANADGMYSPVSAKGVEVWGQGQPPTEMHAISPTHLQAQAKHPSPGMAQGRWSHLQSQLADGSDQGTPLRNSFQREDVGPGTGQVQDPNLHEQYFSVDDDPDADAYHGLSGPSDGQHQYHQPQAIGVAHGQPHVPQVHMQDYERGHFI